MAPSALSLSSLPLLLLLLPLAALLPGCKALNVMYPFFPFPGESWLSMASLAKANSKVTFTLVLNVKNGPGDSASALYSAGIQKLAPLPNVRLMGYIDSSNGNCFNWAKASAVCAGKKGPNTVSQVLSQISRWTSFYGAKNLDGFYFDNFLPYGGSAAKSTASVNSVLQDYSNIYKIVKSTYPSYLVAGNAGLLNPAFKASSFKVADVVAVQQAARNVLANPGDPTQASLKYVPAGYTKALILNKLVDPVADAKKQVSQAVALAKSWGASYFVAVRDFTVFPSDIMPFQVAALT